MNSTAKGPAAASRRIGPPGMKDLTTGPIGKTLFLFSLPVLGSNVLHSLNGSANAIWVSHALGEAALAATVNANNIFFLLLGAVFGVTMAANLLISHAVGARDTAMVKRVVGTSTTFFLILSLAVGVFGYLGTPTILDLMKTPAEARGDAIAYLRVIFMAMPFFYFFSYVMMVQRGAGDSRTPFFFALLAVGLDILLNPLLILGVGPFPRMGITGSATSTLISQTVTLVAMILHLYRRDSVLALRGEDWRLLRPRWAIIKTLLLKGLPMAVQMLVVSGAAVVMISFVNGFGTLTSAGYGAAVQLWTYVQMPAMALGAAVSSMAAQNVGAGKMDRVMKIARSGSFLAILMTGVPIALIYLLERWALALFLPIDSPAMAVAVHVNEIVLWSFLMFGVAFVLSGVVRATGAVWAPLLAMIISLWIVRIPFTEFLIPRWGVDAVWWSFPVGNAVSITLAVAYFLWGGWRKARLIDPTPRGASPDTGLSPPMVIEETEVADEVAEAKKA